MEAPDLTSNIFVEYILGASGSMMGQLADHTRKRDVAQKVFISRLGSFPPQIHIGFRAFGHSMDWRGREDAGCQDIELIAPVPDRAAGDDCGVAQRLHGPGDDPLAQAIRYAVEDLPKADGVNNAIVLISDGKTCGGDRVRWSTNCVRPACTSPCVVRMVRRRMPKLLLRKRAGRGSISRCRRPRS